MSVLMRPTAEQAPSSTSPDEESAIPPVVRIQLEAARRLGLEAELLDPEHNYLYELRHGGRAILLLGGRSPLNDAVAARLCEDKFYTELLLRRAGCRVTRSARCLSPHDVRAPVWEARAGLGAGLKLAATEGYPLVVKPNRMSHGRGVRLVDSEADLRAAVEDIWRYDYCALVQSHVTGLDLRLNFLDGEYLLGYLRAPLRVVADGRRTLRELLVAADARFADEAFWQRATRDPIWREKVTDRGWDDGVVFPRGVEVRFGSGILNLNRWAVARLLPTISDEWHTFGLRIGRVLNLRHFGVDCKVPGPDATPDEATIIEVNSSPLLVQLHRMGYVEEVLAAQMRVLRAIFGL